MILVYNRTTKSYEEEKVAGVKYLEWCYQSPSGRRITELIVKKKICSKLYGFFCDSKLSKKKIPQFIDNFNINMSMYSKAPKEFKNFNDFFAREVIPTARPIPSNNNLLMSPVDGRLLAYDNINMNKLVQVKGITYSLKELIGDSEIAKNYDNGICLIFRLCPTDYHRYHFVDSGIPLKNHKIKGNYYSVNPIAVDKIPKLFCQNKREWSIFKSDHFDDILYVEVGATCVGSIIQSYKENKKVNKGDEKGYFKFGGSTVILFLKKDTVKIDSDILKQTQLGYETKVYMGESIGKKIK